MSRDDPPRRLSAVLSILAGALAVGLVASTSGQHRALAVHVAGLLTLLLGLRLLRGRHRFLGGVVALLGLGAVAASFPLGRVGDLAQQLELYPGFVGLLVLTLGLGPVRKGFERSLVTGGTAILVVAVATSGVLYESNAMALLGAIVATVLAWDLGEQAVNVSEQVGGTSRTWPIEATHALGSVVVGAGAVALAVGITNVGVTDVPFAGLSVLLGAAVVLTAALYN